MRMLHLIKRMLFRRDILFHLLICLGIIAVSVGIPLLELFASWFGRLSIFPIPGLCALFLYALLCFLHPRVFTWPRHRVHYLVVVFVGSLALLVWGPAQFRFFFLIMLYGLVVHARVAFNDIDCFLVEAAVSTATLLGMLLTGGTEFEEQLRRTIVALGIGTREPTIILQFCIWLLGLCFLHLFVGLGVHERANRLKSEGLVAELRQTQRQLRAYALRAEEVAIVRERSRVAREIHDTLAQGLAAIKMHLEIEAAAHQGREASARLEQIRILAGTLLDEARHSILELRTEALEGNTLPEALHALALSCSVAENGDSMTVAFQADEILAHDNIWSTVSLAVTLTCYRIAQEALANARKHGKAGYVLIELSLEGDELCLTVTDNGCGFDLELAASKRERRSFGIIGMRERARAVGGSLEIISAPAVGTQVVAMIPLSSQDTEIETV